MKVGYLFITLRSPKSRCHQKRRERVRERERCTNTEATGHGERPDPDQIRAPWSSDLHHNPHPNNLQNSSTYNAWLFNKNGQLKIKINTSEHREQIPVLQIRLTKQGLSHVRSTMHTILIATGVSSDACEVRSLIVRLVRWASKPHSLPTALTFDILAPSTQKPSSNPPRFRTRPNSTPNSQRILSHRQPHHAHTTDLQAQTPPASHSA
jgi:hypothetical protein